MVDLMMWLVIAALLLAAAIQGIGYYQQAAYLYQVKNDVMGGATKVLSVSGMNHNGTVDQPIVDEGLNITQKTAQVALVSDTDPNGKPMIRGTHPGIPGKEVDYFFYPYAGYAANTDYIVNVGTVSSGPNSTTMPTSSPSASPSGTATTSPTAMSATDEFATFKNSVYAGSVTKFTNPDGSVTTWNYTDPEAASAYGHPHTPIEPSIIGAGQGDIARLKKVSAGTIAVTFITDGSMTQSSGAVGGHFNLSMHGDMTCQNPNGTYESEYVGSQGVTLDAWYLNSSPPPKVLSADANFSCLNGQTITGLVLRPVPNVNWSGYNYMFTRDMIIDWAPAP